MKNTLAFILLALLWTACSPAPEAPAPEAVVPEAVAPEAVAPEAVAPPPAEPEAPATAEIFLPGLVSTAAPEFATSFAPDGGRVYFNRANDDRSRLFIVSAVRAGDTWHDEGITAFADGTWRDVDPFVSRDGSRLYWSSNRGVAGGEAADFNIWYVEQTADETWGEPTPLEAPIHSTSTEIFATLAADGTIYFGSDRDGVGDIYRAESTDVGYGEPERLGLASDEATSVGNPGVAADQSFVLMSSAREGSLGGSDLWVSFRRDDGWSAPRPLKEPANSPYADFAPALDFDERYLYFTSERPGVVPEGGVEGRPPGDIYRVELSTVLPE